jgi:hypothetical protein
MGWNALEKLNSTLTKKPEYVIMAHIWEAIVLELNAIQIETSTNGVV